MRRAPLAALLALGLACGRVWATPTYTPRLNLCKPTQGDFSYTSCVNGNFDVIDSLVYSTTDNTKVLKTGDSMTGPLTVFNSSITIIGGDIKASGIRFDNGTRQTSAALPIGATLRFNDDFSAYTSTNICFQDGLAFGPWTSVFNGYGCNKVLNSGTSTYLVITSSPPAAAAETHASLVVGPRFQTPIDFSAQVKTLAQIRTGSAANPWEVGWVLWGYIDNTHFYAAVIKPNGWQISKEDPAYPGNERFLTSGVTPLFPVGSTYTVRITQDANNLISLYANGNLLGTFVDTERPYEFGSIALYEEDSRVEWTNTVVNDTTTASAPFVPSNDVFGIFEAYPTVTGGKEWHSTFHTSPAHHISGIQTPSVDPWDSFLDAAHGNANFDTDGSTTGILSVSSGTGGAVGSTVRLYVHDPACPYTGATGCTGVAPQWRDVEATAYVKLLSGHTGDNWECGSVALRTKHGPDTDLCDTRGYHLRVRCDGTLDVFKETAHPAGTVGNAIDNPAFVGAFPTDTWIGVKGIAYDLPNGDVKLEIWEDTTDGLNGGSWSKVWEFVDNGANLGGSAACSGQSSYTKLTSSGTRAGSESGYPNLSVYWRHTNESGSGPYIQYKRMSVREITTTISNGVSGGNYYFTQPVTFQYPVTIANSSLTLTGANGFVNANTYYGDGSHLSAIPSTTSLATVYLPLAGGRLTGITSVGSGTSVSTITATGLLQLVAASTITAPVLYISSSANSPRPALVLSTANTIGLSVGASTAVWRPGYCITISSNGSSDSFGIVIATTSSTTADTIYATVSLPPNLLSNLGDGFSARCIAHRKNPTSTSAELSVVYGGTKLTAGSTALTGVVNTYAEISYFQVGMANWWLLESQNNSALNANSNTTPLNLDMTKGSAVSCQGKGASTGAFDFDYMRVCFQ